MGGIVGGGPDISAAPPPAPPPSREDPAIEEARRKELERTRRLGTAATILTSGEGDTSQASLARKMLLGQ